MHFLFRFAGEISFVYVCRINMVRDLFVALPFCICLCWLAIFLLGFRRFDSARRTLTWFNASCVLLYLCHAMYFFESSSVWTEALWICCSLSVYPLYYIYIDRLTSVERLNRNLLWILLPAIVVAVCSLTLPSQIADTMRKILFTIEVTAVCCLGLQRLRSFDIQLKDVYADTDKMDTSSIRVLLICFVFTSVCSAVFNIIGRDAFRESVWQLALPSTLFSVMLFSLFYIGYTREFTIEQLREDTVQDVTTETDIPVDSVLGRKLQSLMDNKKVYLRKNLKVGDVAAEAGVCRTYISTYINKTLGVTFSDYINRQRVEYAKQLMLDDNTLRIEHVAGISGFSSEVSFYRSFKKFEGVTPDEWLHKA